MKSLNELLNLFTGLMMMNLNFKYSLVISRDNVKEQTGAPLDR